MLRRIYRSLLDRELGVLGGEIDAALARYEDQYTATLALKERLEKLVNRVSMRMARNAREGHVDGLSTEDAKILQGLAQGAGDPRAADDPFGDPHFGR